jgi:hypothetical protein
MEQPKTIIGLADYWRMPRLESPLPEALRAERGTALFLYGSGSAGIRRLTVEVDGAPHPVAARGMPRPDLGERGGWWATVPVPPRPGGAVVELATRADGGPAVRIGALPVRAADPPPPLPRPASLVVCLATYEPDEALLRAQVESLRAQTETDWVCLVSDDASSPDGLTTIERVLAGDDRFVLHASDRRRGFYRNFERALALVPDGVELVALCDQDDRWDPDKLATLRAALGPAVLAYSDQRLTDRDGRVLRPTLWRGRAPNRDDLLSMLVANAVTGAATLFRRELLDVLLPFPDTPGLQFHDHWLGCAALATGAVVYVDRPLYDYVQHPGAVFGEVSSGRRGRRRNVPRAAYFLGYLAREVLAQTLLARTGAGAPQRAVLERFAAAQRSPSALRWLATAPDDRTTLGSQRELVQGVLWRWAASARLARDASFPDPLAFEQQALRRWRAG